MNYSVKKQTWNNQLPLVNFFDCFNFFSSPFVDTLIANYPFALTTAACLNWFSRSSIVSQLALKKSKIHTNFSSRYSKVSIVSFFLKHLSPLLALRKSVTCRSWWWNLFTWLVDGTVRTAWKIFKIHDDTSAHKFRQEVEFNYILQNSERDLKVRRGNNH